MFQNTGNGATTLPVTSLRIAMALLYWPRKACVGTSAARSWIFSTISLRLASSVSSAKALRSRVSSSSQGQPNQASLQVVGEMLLDIGLAWEAVPDPVWKMFQPPCPRSR